MAFFGIIPIAGSVALKLQMLLLLLLLLLLVLAVSFSSIDAVVAVFTAVFRVVVL